LPNVIFIDLDDKHPRTLIRDKDLKFNRGFLRIYAD
jgi:hypothetical protein